MTWKRRVSVATSVALFTACEQYEEAVAQNPEINDWLALAAIFAIGVIAWFVQRAVFKVLERKGAHGRQAWWWAWFSFVAVFLIGIVAVGYLWVH